MPAKKTHVAAEVIEYRSSERDGNLIRILPGEEIPDDFPDNDIETLKDQKAIITEKSKG